MHGGFILQSVYSTVKLRPSFEGQPRAETQNSLLKADKRKTSYPPFHFLDADAAGKLRVTAVCNIWKPLVNFIYYDCIVISVYFFFSFNAFTSLNKNIENTQKFHCSQILSKSVLVNTSPLQR